MIMLVNVQAFADFMQKVV